METFVGGWEEVFSQLEGQGQVFPEVVDADVEECDLRSGRNSAIIVEIGIALLGLIGAVSRQCACYVGTMAGGVVATAS